MDIHKPKPWHGWREFLKEYAIIVLGVLTAIGAEQVAEGLHWRERTHLAEEALREDLSASSAPAQSAILLAKCNDDVLDGLERALLAPGEDWRPPFVVKDGATVRVFSAPMFMLGSEAWRNVQADGAASHLPHRTQALYAIAYDRLAQLQAVNTETGPEISELNSLSIPRKIDPQSRTSYLRLLYRVRGHMRVALRRAEQLIDASKALGVEIADPKDDGVLKGYQRVCASLQAGEKSVTET